MKTIDVKKQAKLIGGGFATRIKQWFKPVYDRKTA